MILKPIPIKIRMQKEKRASFHQQKQNGFLTHGMQNQQQLFIKNQEKKSHLNDSVQFMNRSLAQITGENMIGANGRSVPEMALPESYNYIHKSGTLHEAPSPIIPLNWSKASMTLMLKEMSNLINDEGIK